MKRIIVWLNLLIKKNKKMKRWQRIVTVMAAIITFVTTYALILPAITVEREAVDDVGGMYLEEAVDPVEQMEDTPEEDALIPVSVQIAADKDNAVPFLYEDEEMSAVAVFATDEKIPEDAVLVVNPVDQESEMYADLGGRAAKLLALESVNEVKTCVFYDFALLCDGVDVTPKSGLADIRIYFYNNSVEHYDDVIYGGKFGLKKESEEEIASADAGEENASVKEEEEGLVMASADQQADNAVYEERVGSEDDVVVDEELVGSAEMPEELDDEEASGEEDDQVMSEEKDLVEGEATTSEEAAVDGDETAPVPEDNSVIIPGDELMAENTDNSPVVELSDGVITGLTIKGFDLADNDSVAGLYAGTALQGISDENTEEIMPVEDDLVLTAAGKDYTVKVTCDAESGVPKNASLEVSEIKEGSKEYRKYLEETKKAMGLTEEDNLPRLAARFFDIKIMADDTEITPDSGVTVEIAYTEQLAEEKGMEVSALHFADGPAQPDVLDANVTEISEDGTSNVEFTAESFSVYGVIYTVDFHYEVNGKTYDFSIPGGGFISLEHLVEVLGISESDDIDVDADKDDDKNGLEEAAVYRNALKLNEVEVSEATKAFVADVESVVFSNPEFVWVGKAAKDTTIGKLKKANKLDCQNSADLTEEQLAEIDAQTVEAGDWALISVLPFSSKESLTVTMKNGDVWTIEVTDVRIGNNLNGETFIIKSASRNLAMTADEGSLNAGSLNALDQIGGINQHWEFEYVNENGGTYRLKNVAQQRYIIIDRNGNITLTNNQADATQFWVDEQDGTYQFSTMLPPSWTTMAYLNIVDVNGSPRYKIGSDPNQRYTLDEARTVDEKGDWLLFLDEEQDDIYIRVGDTITLRPYDKWTWKVGSDTDAAYRWKFDGCTDAPGDSQWETSIYGTSNEDANSMATWTARDENNNVIIEFKRHVKYDNQLTTRYWSIQGTAKNPGVYVLKNTQNNHEIRVHVLPADDTSHLTGVTTGEPNIKVNLFDYDKEGRLDPLNNGNASGSYEQAINIYWDDSSKRWVKHDLLFSSSGGGSGINEYTKDHARTGIVATTLGEDHFPVLADGSQESLAYLFDTSKTSWSGGRYNDAIIAYPGLTGLFQKDKNGYYYYNSNSNYAYYDPGDDPDNPNKSITLYEHTYTQTRTLGGNDEHHAGLFNSKPIGFFPFHEYDSKDDLWVNQNKKLNHHIGMSMEVKFALPSGKVTEDGNPITFEFTGDDDIWVYVDDDLSLDLGGIHQPIYGKIDFTNNNDFVAGREYTLRVFYLERGGCDSNCAIKFNMPLTIGAADVNVVKHSKEDDQPLPGAEFGIWDKEDCTGEPLRTATSDAQGNVHFDKLPIFKVGQVYYMKETKAPSPYFLDSTVYKLTAERIGETDNFRFVISVDKPGADSLATTDGNDPLPIIDNTVAEDIKLTIKKSWQNADTTPSDAPQGATAKFKVKRWRTYNKTEEKQAYQVNLYDANTNQVLTNGSRWAYEGDALTIRYNHCNDPNPSDEICQSRTGIDALALNTAQGWHTVQYTVDSRHANVNTNTIDIMIPGGDQGFLHWCSNLSWYNGTLPYFTDGSTTNPGPQQVPGETIHELDTAYNESATEGIYELPYNNTWTIETDDLPTTGTQTIDGKTYTCYYDYYIEEVESADGYEAIYYDSKDHEYPASDIDDLATHADGEQKIVNRKLINIPVEKRWPDYEHEGYIWWAKLHLDYREVPLDGSEPSPWGEYREGEDDYDDYFIELDNAHSAKTFTDLPMYVVNSEGKLCRREYSVVEKAYEVRDSEGELVASFDGTTYLPDDDHRYALWYQHDAGEDDNYDDTDYPGEEDYDIMVYNMHEKRTVTKDLDLRINKVWKDTDGKEIESVPDTYKTKFVLRRNVVVEYRNYENETTPLDYWVYVKLVSGEKSQILRVPPNRPMHIRGNLVEGKDPTLITFKDPTGAEYRGARDNAAAFADYNLFEVNFTAPPYGNGEYSAVDGDGNPVDPFVIELITGEKLVVGEYDGFILSDSTDRQPIGLDQTFSKEFELSNLNDWTKIFSDDIPDVDPDDPHSQFEHDHPLPAIEVSILDQDGLTANTYIYTYYFEEVESTPASFHPTYADSTGSLIGDENHQFYSDDTITATNSPNFFKIEKVDKDRNSKKLKGAKFEIRKLEGDEEHPPVAAEGGTFAPDTSFGTDGTLELPLTDKDGLITVSGNPEQTGLLPGYYEVEEKNPPTGYILAKKVQFYLKVEAGGNIILMKKDGNGLVEDTDGKTDDNLVTLSSESTENGKTFKFAVKNEPGATLPHTGGSGTQLFKILGIVLIAFAGAGFAMRRRWRNAA